MRFDVAAKYGKTYSYVTTVDATDSREACKKAASIHGRKLWGAKPADTCVPYYKHKIG